MNNQNKCLSCGMPMAQKGDFEGGDTVNKYCKHCTSPDGTLKTYEEVLAGMTNLIVTRMDTQEAEAMKTAKENLSKMPAWQNQN